MVTIATDYVVQAASDEIHGYFTIATDYVVQGASDEIHGNHSN